MSPLVLVLVLVGETGAGATGSPVEPLGGAPLTVRAGLRRRLAGR